MIRPGLQRPEPTHPVAAEDVLAGHPDRLCDAVAEAVVETALSFDPDALVAVEVALHRDLLLVTGRVAAGTDCWPPVLDAHSLEALVARVLDAAGYAGRWAHPLAVRTDLQVDALDMQERELRPYSDDQNVAVGYADPAGPALLPVEAYAARRLRLALAAAVRGAPDRLGPDGKVLVTIDLPAGGSGEAVDAARQRPMLRHLNVSVQHAPDVGYEELHRLVLPALAAALDELSPWLDAPERLDAATLRVNGAGDFSIGGPVVDNGLSGKKLVVDHYGPRVPIGGGALCGKDVHKADRVGPLRARQLAVRLARATGQASTVWLGWLPGLRGPDRITAVLADGTRLSADHVAALVPVPDLTLAGTASDLELAAIPWRTAIDRGYVGGGWPWDQ